MPDVPLSLVPWFDAKDNPPRTAHIRWTDQGATMFASDRVWRHASLGEDPAIPQPHVWCDPSPPDMNDPLTVEDLRWAYANAYSLLVNYHAASDPYRIGGHKVLARLRRTLDQIQELP